MRINENTCIVGNSVVLVPYKEYHVPKYHQWMQSEELQQQTASEPLTLQEEYEMQKSWHLDGDKCTFIILDKLRLEEFQNEIGAMIGDTNLFFSDKALRHAEAEIMIAETEARGMRKGWEAMLMMLRYGVEELKTSEFEAKIKFENLASIKMFTKIGFSEISRSEVFGEYTLCKTVTDEWIQWLCSQTESYKTEGYEEYFKKNFR